MNDGVPASGHVFSEYDNRRLRWLSRSFDVDFSRPNSSPLRFCGACELTQPDRVAADIAAMHSLKYNNSLRLQRVGGGHYSVLRNGELVTKG